MKTINFYIILITWVGILLAPPIAICLFVSVRNKWPQSMKLIIELCVAALLSILCFFVYGISFTILTVNVICFLLAYGIFCFLTASCWLIRFKFFKFLATTIMALPILFGYVLTTIGALGFLFIMGDFVHPPFEKNIIKPGLECRLTGWGGAWGDSGYTVKIFKHWKVLPFIEREMVKIVINESHTQGGPVRATCDDALQQYTGHQTSKIVK